MVFFAANFFIWDFPSFHRSARREKTTARAVYNKLKYMARCNHKISKFVLAETRVPHEMK